MFGRKKKPESENIRKFVDILYQFEMEHPDELCPPITEPQLVVDCLCDVFLGTDWYTALPLNTKQVNTIILDEILRKHSTLTVGSVILATVLVPIISKL